MKKLKYLLLIFIIFLTPKVFAAEYNMNSKTSATLNGTKNRYLGNEIYNTGLPNQYTFGTRYSGKLSTIETYFSYPFEANTTYTLTYNMNTEDFRNTFGGTYWWDCEDTMNATNQHLGSFTYVSYKKVKFSFTPTENTMCIRVLLGSTSIANTAITGVSNWRLDSITLYDPYYQTGGGGGQGSSSPTPTPTSDYSSIINNQNDNTQDIINNQNDNTSDVIENNNENTDKIIDNQNQLLGSQCSNIFNFGGSKNVGSGASDINVGDDFISFSGTSSNVLGSNFVIYTLNLTPNTNYYFKLNNGYQISLLNSSYSTLFTTTWNSFEFNIGNNSTILLAFFSPQNQTTRYSNVMVSTQNKSFCVFDSYTSKIDETTNAINQQNEYLMDNSDPNIADNQFTSLFDTVSFNDPLSYLLQLPVQFINAIVNQSNTCQVVNLGTLLGVSITFPCIDIGSILGSSVWNIIDVIFSVCLLVVIFKNLYQTFANLITLGGEKQAREKFSMPTPMEFLSIILGGDK